MSNCTRGHFYRPFGVFFLRCYILSTFIEAEIQSAALFHRAIMTLQFPRVDAPNIGRKGNAPLMIAIDSIRFFVVFFFVVFFFFGFMLMAILVLVFIAVQTAASAAL